MNASHTWKSGASAGGGGYQRLGHLPSLATSAINAPADQFTFVTPTPTVTGVSPSTGPGGTTVTISGSNLANASSVLFGSVAVTSFTSDTAIAITLNSPPEAGGEVDVRVVTPGGTSAINAPADQFNFVTPTPTVTGVSPASGATAGGTTVTISGSNLANASSVLFGSIAVTSFLSDTATAITLNSPGEAVATVDVRVITPGGTSAINAPADQFTFKPPINVPPPATLPSVANQIIHASTNEYYRYIITQAFETYVGRAPQDSEYAFFLNNVNGQGANFTDEHIESLFIGSPEYVQKKGGTDAAWISSMYNDLLFRTPSQGELDYWIKQLATLRVQDAGNASLSAYQQAAEAFDISDEREGRRVQADYLTYLGRQASTTEVAFWVNQFEHNGQTSETLAAGILSSQEYYDDPSKAFGSDNAWVQAVYEDVLHRAAAQSDVDYWVGLIKQ